MPNAKKNLEVYFSDFFKISPSTIEKYGSFNISLLSDLPLFIDPFLLFNSKKKRYRQLHREIIRYLQFLRNHSSGDGYDEGLIQAWYRFPEVKQTWFGFSATGNAGAGLGSNFAQALHQNLASIFANFGSERITKGSHLEKLVLISPGVGKDKISDFTTNLIAGFLAEYTQAFARKHIHQSFRRECVVQRAQFNYETESWMPGSYELPYTNDDFVLLTPRDLLTKDDIWISRFELFERFSRIPDSIGNVALRAQINNYFRSVLPKKPKKEELYKAAATTIRKFPVLIDYYIRLKEDKGDEAVSISNSKVSVSKQLYIDQFKQLLQLLSDQTPFYSCTGNTYEEALERVKYFRDVIENKGGHRIFYVGGQPIERESDVHILYRMTWFATPSDVTTEANDGRGPVDFKISRGSKDKALVEFKLASNGQLKRNLQKQTEIYQKASGAEKTIKVIIYFSLEELGRVFKILKDLSLEGDPSIVLVDARYDNKPSGSKA